MWCHHERGPPPPWASVLLALSGILSLDETSELLCGLGNVTTASIDIGVSQFWVNYPFKKNLSDPKVRELNIYSQ